MRVGKLCRVITKDEGKCPVDKEPWNAFLHFPPERKFDNSLIIKGALYDGQLQLVLKRWEGATQSNPGSYKNPAI